MIKRLFILLALFSLTTVSFVYATSDICILGSSVVNMSVSDVDKFFEEKLNGSRISGTGKVLSVVQQGSEGTNENVTINAECSNGVRLVLRVDTFWVKRKNVQTGHSVSFSGKCVDVKRRGSRIICIISVTG